MFPAVLLLLSHLLWSLWSQNPFSDAANTDGKKIAFLFMTRGHMPLEDIWREFFNWKANPSDYSIYVHAHAGFKFPSTSFFHGKEIKGSKDVKWGGMSQVRGIKILVRAALEDPQNEWFTLMSESCIPLHPFAKWQRVLFANNKSIVNACDMGPVHMETEARWRPSLEQAGILKTQWRKSATWFAMKRRHAQIFVGELALESAWENVPCCDEHYLPTIFAYYNLDNETTCSDGFMHAFFPGISAHPQTHTGDNINADLFAYLNRPIARLGFSVMCSGFDELCHFTARKFSPASKYALLENMDLILDDDDEPYAGNPWQHYQSMMRVSEDNSTYYLIEMGKLRPIPDKETMAALHMRAEFATPVAASEKSQYEIGQPFPSRVDGLAVKAPRKTTVYIILAGRRHAIPNMDTFLGLNLELKDVKTVSELDLEHIPMGEPIKDVNDVQHRLFLRNSPPQ